MQRVKILFNKKDSALVQFTDSNQATLGECPMHVFLQVASSTADHLLSFVLTLTPVALQHLNGLPLYGNQLRCHRSRHHVVTLGGGDANANGTSGDPNLTRDYSGSRLHRFRSANSRNHQNICGPNAVLHVSGLPEDATEEELHSLVTEVTGQDPVEIKIIP